jgi:hypothetical protein
MNFLAGAMLWGLAAVAIPVIIHLSGRARPVVERFPAMRFLLRSHRASTRVLRLKHLLLLLLRMATIALLAFALARPFFHGLSGGAGQLGQAHGDFVLVLDASLSMQYREADVECFARAREQALRFLSRLAPDSRVALIRAGADAERLQGRLTLNQEGVKAEIERLTAGATGLDLGRALRAAEMILKHAAPGKVETRLGAVICFTDLQRNAYAALGSPGRTDIPVCQTGKEACPAGTGAAPDPAARRPLILVDAGVDGARNGAVLAVRVPGPAVPAEQALQLAARVRPVDPHRSCLVDLYLDGRKVGQEVVPAGADDVREVEFRFVAGAPGLARGPPGPPRARGRLHGRDSSW